MAWGKKSVGASVFALLVASVISGVAGVSAPPCLVAQSQVPTTQQQAPTLQTLAGRVDRHYNQLRSLKASFSESYEGLGMRRTERGTLLLMKPGRMCWTYSEPKGKLFVLDGKFAWFYADGDPQVQRIAASKLDDMRSPLRFLLGRTQLQKELTGLTLSTAPNGGFMLAGKLKGQEKRVAQVRLTVTLSGSITRIEIEEVDGAITTFTLRDEEPNAAISPDSFRFNPPTGVPVVDALPPI